MMMMTIMTMMMVTTIPFSQKPPHQNKLSLASKKYELISAKLKTRRNRFGLLFSFVVPSPSSSSVVVVVKHDFSHSTAVKSHEDEQVSRSPWTRNR